MTQRRYINYEFAPWCCELFLHSVACVLKHLVTYASHTCFCYGSQIKEVTLARNIDGMGEVRDACIILVEESARKLPLFKTEKYMRS
jgi:hypothetical protein